MADADSCESTCNDISCSTGECEEDCTELISLEISDLLLVQESTPETQFVPVDTCLALESFPTLPPSNEHTALEDRAPPPSPSDPQTRLQRWSL